MACRPGRSLRAAHVVRDAHDEHVAQAVQQDGQWQQQRIGVRGQSAGREMCAPMNTTSTPPKNGPMFAGTDASLPMLTRT